MAHYLIEMTVYDPALPGTRTLYFSTHGYNSLPTDVPANTHYAPRVVQPGNYEQHMFQAGKTSGVSQVGFGEVVLSNPDGALDELINYGIDGRPIVFKTISKLGAVLLLASCSMEQPEFSASEVTVRIKDPQAIFNTALQPTKYAGDNLLPEGVEGSSDIKGQPKPLTFGRVFNVTPRLVNTSKLVYQVHTSLVDIPAAYDKGVSLLRGDDYVSQAAMEAAAPNPAEYRVWPAGGCFRLGSSPVGQVTADVVEGATAADRTVAQVGKRLASRVIPAETISAVDVAALDLANSAEVGIYVSDESTVMAALDQVFGSVGAWYGFDSQMDLRMQQFTAPTGEPDATLTVDDAVTLDRFASNDAGRGIPLCKVNLDYAKNYTVQTSDLAGSVASIATLSRWSAGDTGIISYTGRMVYGNGLFVAISRTIALTSVDGENWTPRILPALPEGVYWGGISYGNGLFFAASGDSVITSYDGITWTSHALPLSAEWTAGAYGDGTFVLVARGSDGSGGIAVSSVDGTTWVRRVLPTGMNWDSVVHGKGRFVAVANGDWEGSAASTSVVATSTDGITWLSGDMATAQQWNDIAYGNGLFIALAAGQVGANVIAVSTDGLTWSEQLLPNIAQWWRIVYGGGVFMIAGPGAFTLTSAAGTGWLPQTLPSDAYSYSVSYGDGKFAMLKYAGSDVFIYRINPSSDRAMWLSREYRTVTSADVSVLTTHLLAPEMNIHTLLVDQAAAQSEADRLLTLYKVRRDSLQVQVPVGVLPYIDLGRVVKVIYHRYGYSAGKLFRVLGTTVDRSAGMLTLTLWG